MKAISLYLPKLALGIGVEVAITTTNFAEWNVDIGVKALRHSNRLKPIGFWPGQPSWQSTQLLLLFGLALIGGERGDEGLLRHLDSAHHLHALFTLFLLLE